MKSASTPITVSFSSKGQVVVPARMRKELGIKTGTKAVIEQTSEGILLRPVTRESVHQLYGFCKRKPGEKSLAEERAELKREELENEERRWRQMSGQRSTR